MFVIKHYFKSLMLKLKVKITGQELHNEMKVQKKLIVYTYYLLQPGIIICI